MFMRKYPKLVNISKYYFEVPTAISFKVLIKLLSCILPEVKYFEIIRGYSNSFSVGTNITFNFTIKKTANDYKRR